MNFTYITNKKRQIFLVSVCFIERESFVCYNDINDKKKVKDMNQPKKNSFFAYINVFVCYTMAILPILLMIGIELGFFQQDLKTVVNDFIFFVAMLFLLWPIVIILYSNYNTKQYYQNYVDSFASNFQYYREYSKKYPIFFMGYLYKGYLDKDDVVATIMEFIEKGYMYKQGSAILVKQDVFMDSLRNSERYFIENYKDIIRANKNNLLESWKCEVRKDLVKEKLWNNVSPFYDMNYQYYLAYIIALFAFAEIFQLVYPGHYIIFIMLGSFFIYVLEFYFVQKKCIDTPFGKHRLRTDEGLTLSYQLRALKRFLTDFTFISERELEEVKNWDKYALYAIIFHLKGNLNDEVRCFYTDIKNFLDK